MSKTFHVGDLHLDHKNVIKFRTQFSSVKEHDEIILNNILTIVGKRDTLWLHGDIFFSLEAVKNYLPQLKKVGHLRILLGNHDLERMNMFERKEALFLLNDSCYYVGGLFKHKSAWLTHAPIHQEELRGSICIHGHVHSNTLEDKCNYYNVSLENTNYTAVSREHINEVINYHKNTKN